MDELERLEHLESRLARVESELQNLVRAIDVARGEDPSLFARSGDQSPAESSSPAEPSSPTEPSIGAAFESAAASTGTALPDYRARRTFSAPASPKRGFEAWFGENALLVVGVLALIAAVGFALKHAFEQGWVSPALRVLAGLFFGLGLAAYGEGEQRRGLHRFGAAAVGAGAAIAYLSIWAASGPYAFISSPTGILALAALSGLVLLSAWRSDEVWLAAIAAVGAYLAPFVLGDATTSADLLLVYSVLVTGAVALAAGRREWGATMGIVIVGFFWVAVAAHGRADSAWFALYLASGGGLAVLGLRRLEWLPHELAAWSAAWLGLFAGAVDVDTGAWQAWAYAVAPFLLVAPGWAAAVREGSVGPRRLLLRRALLVASALAWTTVLLVPLPVIDDDPILPVAAVALLYLVPAIRRRVPELLTASLGVGAMGIAAQWEASDLTLGWAVLVVGAGFLARREPLSASRWAAVLLGFFAVQRLLTIDQVERVVADPAFLGAWSWTFYVLVAALVLLAINGWNADNRRIAGQRGLDLQVTTWLLAGALVLIGGTMEIDRLFTQRIGRGTDLAALASGLSVSAFWLLYAGGLLAFGFRTNRQAVRITGLVVAALAILKVAFWDLARLEALYRVGSFALLAVIALVGAHAYHRRARSEGTAASEGPSPPGAGSAARP